MAGQIWVTNSLGGFLYSDQLSEILRHAVQPMVRFRQFCDAKDASTKAKKTGDAFHWDVFSNIATAGTTVLETSTIPQSNFTITQGTLTVTEAANSVPFTEKLDNLSFLPVRTIINQVLKNDASKALDTLAHAQFNATPLRVAPTGGTSTSAVTLTTNGTATLTNNVAFGKLHAQAIVDIMKERNIPAYQADDYYAVAWPTTFRKLRQDLESVHQYTETGFGQIMNGEIGRYEGIRYCEQTNIAKLAWTNGLSDFIYFFGGDTVMEGVVVWEELRGAIPTDYGRSQGIAWYYLGGYGLVHTAAANARIVKWDSAA